MKRWIISGVLTGSILLTGCGKQSDPAGGSHSPTKTQNDTASVVVPATQPAMTAWEKGDELKAVRSFVETDWSVGPLFATSSTLSLTEGQFVSLSNAERQAKSTEMMSQLDSLKRLVSAVAQTGRDAVSAGDIAQARKYFESLKQCAKALDNTNRLRIVQMVGQGIKRRADIELAKLGQ